MKRAKGESRKRKPVQGRRILSALIPSLLMLCICLACFGGATYAWFSDMENSGDRKFVVTAPEVTAVAMYVKAPKTDLSGTEEEKDDTEDTEDTEDNALSQEERLLEKEHERLAALQGMSTDDWIREEKADPLTGEFSLKADTPYVMRFTYEDTGAEEQPEECFLLLKIGEKKYYTAQIGPGEQLELFLKASDAERSLRYTVIPGKSEDRILDGFTLWESSEEEDPMAVLEETAQEKIDIRVLALEQEIEQAELKLQEKAEAVKEPAPGTEAKAENEPVVVPEAPEEAGAVTETETETAAATETGAETEIETAEETMMETETAASETETAAEAETETAAEAETETETETEAETAAATEAGTEAPLAAGTEEQEQQAE